MAGNANSGRRRSKKPAEPAFLADLRAFPPADRAVEFINSLPHSTGRADASFALRPWQERFVRQLLETKADGARKIRKAFLFIARKNGKSELAAAVALFFLRLDVEGGLRGAEVVSCAASRDQASRIYRAAKAMVLASPLRDLIAYSDVAKKLTVTAGEAEGNTFQSLSSDAGSNLGANPSCVIFDEVVVGTAALWEAMETAQGARPQPLFLAITTAGPHDPNSLLWREYSYAKDCLTGAIPNPDSYLPVLYEVPADADWRTSATGIWQTPDSTTSAPWKTCGSNARKRSTFHQSRTAFGCSFSISSANQTRAGCLRTCGTRARTGLIAHLCAAGHVTPGSI
jgi:phage terminase large subunit-like protein